MKSKIITTSLLMLSIIFSAHMIVPKYGQIQKVKKTSHSYLKCHRFGDLEDATPVFNTTDGIIKIRLESHSGGKISGCRLVGQGGSFNLKQGTHEIPPGQYTHYLDGFVLSPGEIHSYIEYYE